MGNPLLFKQNERITGFGRGRERQKWPRLPLGFVRGRRGKYFFRKNAQSRCQAFGIAVEFGYRISPMKAIRFRPLAFTLIELLVVISIIAVLASLTIAGVQTAMIAAKKVQAKNDMAQIANGIQFYYTEYGKYPIGTSPAPVTSGSDVVYGTGVADNRGVIDILRCTSTWAQGADAATLNPRQIKFLQPRVVDAKKGGVYSSTSEGNWYDPWGTEYVIFIDAAYDDDITVKGQFTDIQTNPSFGVGVASLGYYYAKKNTSKAIAEAGLNYSSNKTTILLSW